MRKSRVLLVPVLMLALVAFSTGCGEPGVPARTPVPTIPGQTVVFADPNLEAAVRAEIGKWGDKLLLSDLLLLSWLEADSREIVDCAGLESCSALSYVYLDGNEISDISPLAGLSELANLNLSGNRISDILPLVENTGLGDGDYVDVTDNPLGNMSVNVYIPQLQQRGVILRWTSPPTPSPIATATPAPTPLPTPTVSPTGEVVSFPDSNLDRVVRHAIGKPTGDMYQSDVEGLTSLLTSTTGEDIADLSGLEYCSSLTHLQLWMNRISDLTPLSGLTSLTWLNLQGNQIGNVSPLSGLTDLTYLNLHRNRIRDISPLSDVTGLTHLTLSNNRISDISPLANLGSLMKLDLADNEIGNISALVDNVWLAYGVYVNLAGNPLGNSSVNEYIPELERRGVTVDW